MGNASNHTQMDVKLKRLDISALQGSSNRVWHIKICMGQKNIACMLCRKQYSDGCHIRYGHIQY